MSSFIFNKQKFDSSYGNQSEFNSFLPEHLTLSKKKKIKNKHGEKNEEYFKWQFLYSLVNSGLFIKDYIGTEVFFPKGNKNSAPIKLDGAIFDSVEWFEHYKKYHNENDTTSLDWLRQHLLVAIEFKKEDNKDVENVWNKQLKPAMKESEREFCLGILYDTERLYLFRNSQGKFLRYSDEFNSQGIKSQTKDLSLHVPDPYLNIPSFSEATSWSSPTTKDRSKRRIKDLDVISGVHSTQINNAMSAILRTMDKHGMVDQKGYEILIQVLSLKIYDEKRNEKLPDRFLDFYRTEEERNYKTLAEKGIRIFLKRINSLREDASDTYYRILKDNPLSLKNESHVKLLLEVVSQFQDYSFVRSHKTDLYQLVFYKFATPFSKDQNAQFVTPLPLINFLVNIVNPRNGETIIDPTVGIADFLSVSYVNSKSKLDDQNIYGQEIDEQMVMLATLNMLLNGDGNATIKAKTGYGALLAKFDNKDDFLELIPSMNMNGKWENRPDEKKLKKFDVVLTNPPFGDDRAFHPKDDRDEEVINCYELWDIYGGKKIDLGVIFLENAYRLLKENGRLGIVLSNSIASIETHAKARQWIMDRMRIVAIFDLPPNVFAETGVNTSLLVAYKPNKLKLDSLKEQNYEVFFKSIEKVGYEVKTKKRVKYFDPVYKFNYDTSEIQIDENGKVLLDEEFGTTIDEFKTWCKGQEKTLQDLFIKEK